ncbi:MAG: hypothetical protein IPJ31_08580 [Bacteroidetes bacterium]|nr:hypothetical protein [Bacteroidota bacterium]
MKNKLISLAIIIIGGVTIFSRMVKSAMYKPPTHSIPNATEVYNTKLKNPLSGGQNLIFRVKYFADTTMPQNIDIYHNGNIIYTLKDDGNFPDIIANDFYL